jgi:hypothetical protein
VFGVADGFFAAVHRPSDHEAVRHDVAKVTGIDRIAAQVHPRRACRERNVDPVVDDHPGPAAARYGDELSGDLKQRAS